MIDFVPALFNTAKFNESWFNTRKCYRVAELRKKAVVAELDIPKGTSLLQFTGGLLDQVKVEDMVHPDHPLYKSLSDLKADYDNEEWLAVDIGEKIWPKFQISSFVWEEAGGDPLSRSFTLVLTRMSS